jgi:hypothetical protein
MNIYICMCIHEYIFVCTQYFDDQLDNVLPESQRYLEERDIDIRIYIFIHACVHMSIYS